MAYQQPFLRLVVSGTLFSAETFSWSLALINDFGAGEPPAEVPQAVIDAVTTFHQSSAVAHSQAILTTIKLNEIGVDGRYTDASDTVRYDFETPVPGTASNFNAPQLAVAVSLRTGALRGPAHAGRFYIPFSRTIGSDGRMSNADRNQIITQATTLLSALNVAVPGYDVGVVSNVGAGRQRAVTHVRVGRVVDTIRSRRRSMDEDYADGNPIVQTPDD